MQVTAICCQINLVLWSEGMQVPFTKKKVADNCRAIG
jgi:hypothetical protein